MMWRRATLVVALLAAVTACGGDDDDSSDATTASTAASATTAAPDVTEPASTEPDSTEPDSSEPATTDAPTTTAAPAVEYDTEGRTMRIGQPARPPALYPHKGTSPTIDFTYMSPVYDRLVELNGDGSISPMLAESWEEAADGMSTTFVLREDVKFHDGSPFNADAALANFQAVLNGGESLALRNLQGAGKVTGVEKVDDFTIKFNTSGPSTLLPYWLGVSMEAGGIVNPAALSTPDALATTMHGSGPYKLVEVLQDRILYEKNPDYWDEEVLASSADKLEIIGFGDDQAKINALVSGQIDVLSLLAPVADLQKFVDDNDLQIFKFSKTARSIAFYTNINQPPLDNPRVRQALSMAIDRQSMADVIGRDFCIPTVQPFGEGYTGHDPDLVAAAEVFDIEGAKKILAEEGVGPFTIKGVKTESSLFNISTQIVQANWAELGVTLEVQTIPTQQATAEFGTGNYGIYSSSLSGNAEAMIFLNDIYLTRGALNTAPDELKALAATAEATELASDERNEAFQDISAYLVENPTHFVFCTWPNVLLSSQEVTGLDRNAMLTITAPIDSRHMAFVKS